MKNVTIPKGYRLEWIAENDYDELPETAKVPVIFKEEEKKEVKNINFDRYFSMIPWNIIMAIIGLIMAIIGLIKLYQTDNDSTIGTILLSVFILFIGLFLIFTAKR